jgi:hypothetical protein
MRRPASGRNKYAYEMILSGNIQKTTKQVQKEKCGTLETSKMSN